MPVIPTVEEKKVEPVIPVVPQVEEQVKPSEPTEAEKAVVKYVDLMNKRKEAIALKQQCEKEMTALVNEYKISLDMVNAELSKRGAQEVA